MAPIAVERDEPKPLQGVSGLNEAGVAHTLAKDETTAPANGQSTPILAPLDMSLMTTTLTTSSRPVPAPASPEAVSMETCTDHMISAQWDVRTGWAAPSLHPYGPLSIMPSASVLHYATECFEGMRLYRGHDGALRLFRPERNARRMLMSATRIALPAFEPAQLLAMIERLAAVDAAKWLPTPGTFLYIRPTMIANDPALGVQQPRRALLYVILAMFPAQDTNPAGMRLLASQEDTVRAWPGGFGYAKVGASYGPSLVAQGEARRRGFAQVLWLLQRDGRIEVTEAGASNFFCVLRQTRAAGGALELVTPGLESKIILDGVTRNSVLALARERLAVGRDGVIEGLEVRERNLEMRELVEAADEDRLVEAFAVGTAFFVSAISAIGYGDREIAVPMAQGSIGTYAGLIKGWIGGIMYGKEQHEWGHVVTEIKHEDFKSNA